MKNLNKFDLLCESIVSELNPQKEYTDEDIQNMRSILFDVYVEDPTPAEEDDFLTVHPDELTDEEVITEYENRFGVHGEEYDESEQFDEDIDVEE
jgi:hypothetical protein